MRDYKKMRAYTLAAAIYCVVHCTAALVPLLKTLVPLLRTLVPLLRTLVPFFHFPGRAWTMLHVPGDLIPRGPIPQDALPQPLVHLCRPLRIQSLHLGA